MEMVFWFARCNKCGGFHLGWQWRRRAGYQIYTGTQNRDNHIQHEPMSSEAQPQQNDEGSCNPPNCMKCPNLKFRGIKGSQMRVVNFPPCCLRPSVIKRPSFLWWIFFFFLLVFYHWKDGLFSWLGLQMQIWCNITRKTTFQRMHLILFCSPCWCW